MTNTTTNGLEVRLVLDDKSLERLADLLAERLTERAATTDTTRDSWLSTKDAAGYLGISVHALHKLTAARRIPFEQERPGTKCWFRRSELDAWRQA